MENALFGGVWGKEGRLTAVDQRVLGLVVGAVGVGGVVLPVAAALARGVVLDLFEVAFQTHGAWRWLVKRGDAGVGRREYGAWHGGMAMGGCLLTVGRVIVRLSGGFAVCSGGGRRGVLGAEGAVYII